MSGYSSYKKDLLIKYTKRHKVPIIKATPKNFKKYGHFVHNYDMEEVIITPWPTSGRRPIFPGTGVGGGIVEGKFEYWKDGIYMKAANKAVNGYYTTGIIQNTSNKKIILTREANYHPDSGQVFYPITSGPFILLLALPGDDIQLKDFVGFYFSGLCGVQILPNIWHQPILPIEGKAEFMTKQGKVHACVVVDTIKEFGTWLEISL